MGSSHEQVDVPQSLGALLATAMGVKRNSPTATAKMGRAVRKPIICRQNTTDMYRNCGAMRQGE